MIPSVVAHEVARAQRDFLAEQENLVKGPYLSIAPPPKLAPEGEPFGDVPLGFHAVPPSAHCVPAPRFGRGARRAFHHRGHGRTAHWMA